MYVFMFNFYPRCCCCCCLLLLPTTSVLKRREMLGTSIAVVFGCFYFCPVDCDASVMVVGCAAVWKKNTEVATKYVFISIFWSR